MKNIKKLLERREELQQKMQQMVETADAEERAMTEEEIADFDKAEKEIRAIDATIEAENRATSVNVQSTPPAGNPTDAEREAAEERAFVDYVLNRAVENRAGEIQLTQGNNGGIVPVHIAKRIIKEVKDMVPFLQMADVISTNGKLSVPVYSETDVNKVNAGYVEEGAELVDNVGKFTTVDLTGHLFGALALVTKKLQANTDIDVVSFIVTRVSEAMAEALEKEFVVGTDNKISGLLSATAGVTAASATAVTYDELVQLKHSIKRRFRGRAAWIMHPTTYTAVCKLKDQNGQPYFKEADYKILDLPVIESDSMPEIASGKKAIICGDLKGYTIKETTGVEISVLREKFATRGMLGVMAYAEYDGKITDGKRIKALQMA